MVSRLDLICLSSTLYRVLGTASGIQLSSRAFFLTESLLLAGASAKRKLITNITNRACGHIVRVIFADHLPYERLDFMLIFGADREWKDLYRRITAFAELWERGSG